MNKKLIALAVAGASIAPAAMAQTANTVTLYGRAYVTLESVEIKNSTIGRRTRVEDQSSLLGVRGTEDLGGGLKAFFQLETSFRLDQNTSTFANRNSGVAPPSASMDSNVTYARPYSVTGFAVCAMASAGARLAPATARAISFLFI